MQMGAGPSSFGPGGRISGILEDRTPSEYLLQIINLGRTSRSIDTLTPQSSSFRQLANNTQLLKALLDLHEHPLSFDPRRYPAVLSPHDIFLKDVCQYYIRLYSAKRSQLELYRNENPEDEMWADNMLHAVGSDKEIIIPYVGMTLEGSPTSRYIADSSANMYSRLSRLKKCGIEKAVVFEWISLQRSAEPGLKSRAISDFDDIERNLIAVVSPFCINSASGGRYFQWQPESNFVAAIRKALSKGIGPIKLERLVEEEEELQNRAWILLENEYRLFRASIPIPPLATIESKNSTVKDATSNIRPLGKGKTLAAFIPSEISREAAKGGADYMSPTAGPAPKLERLARSLVGLDHEDDAGYIRLPRHDLWPFVPSKNAAQYSNAATALLSTYLQTLQPIIIVVQSGMVAELVQQWQLAQVWNSSEAAQNAMAFLDTIQDLHGLQRYTSSDKSMLRHKAMPAFTQVLGSVEVVKYGPEDKHHALCIYERDPGSIFYDTKHQTLYAEQHLLCKASYVITSRRVVSEKDSVLECTEAEFPKILARIRDKVKNDLGVLDDLWQTRQEHQKEANKDVSTRTKGVPRPEYSRSSHKNNELALGSPIQLSDLMEAGQELFPVIASERIEQWNRIMSPMYNRRELGEDVQSFLCPSSLEFLSIDHRDWFLRQAKDYDYTQGVKTHSKKMTKKAGYQETRDRVGLNNRRPMSGLCAMNQLVEPLFKLRNRQYVKYTCKLCKETGTASVQSKHSCPGQIGQVTVTSDTLWRQALRYPHEIYDATDNDNQKEVDVNGTFLTKEARDVLADATAAGHFPREILDQIREEPLGLVYYQEDSHLEFRVTMAVDRLLEKRCCASFNLSGLPGLPQNHPSVLDKTWLTTLNVDRVRDHITDQEYRYQPVLTATCPKGCGKRSLFFKTVRESAGRLLHKCPGNTEETLLDLADEEICGFFEFPSQLARHYWSNARSAEFKKGDATVPINAPSIQMLRWHTGHQSQA
ncbi:hypothetical protein BGZ81_002138 [Podila clonocystis]|nr:hypothetical protein BGZ81_002138 [Podila clonocystis]